MFLKVMRSFIATFVILSSIPETAACLEVQRGVYEKSASELRTAEARSKLKMWTWLGFVQGNDEHDPLHAAKRRSTFIAHHEDPNASIHYVIVWSHGMGGFTKFEDNMFPQLRHLISTGKSFTLIEPELPWSTNVSNIEGRPVWSRRGSFKEFVENSLKIAPKVQASKVVRLVVGGHSRGGKSISRAFTTGGLCEMNPFWIIWSDASYGDWLGKAMSACLKSQDVKTEIFYIKNTGTQASVLHALKNSSGKNILSKPMVSPWYHGKVGNNAIIMSEAFK